ncbi:MAG: hypothetical protein IJN74_00065 [Clostridia bacterium]|nr:hypothetical protein [Clostridia bacterium]
MLEVKITFDGKKATTLFEGKATDSDLFATLTAAIESTLEIINEHDPKHFREAVLELSKFIDCFRRD